MDHLTSNEPVPTSQSGKRRMVKLALAGTVAAAVLASSGVAHAGYRWRRVAPPTTVVTTTTVAPPTTVTVPVKDGSSNDGPVGIAGYRWR